MALFLKENWRPTLQLLWSAAPLVAMTRQDPRISRPSSMQVLTTSQLQEGVMLATMELLQRAWQPWPRTFPLARWIA
jgi:hypothetical protein